MDTTVLGVRRKSDDFHGKRKRLTHCLPKRLGYDGRETFTLRIVIFFTFYVNGFFELFKCILKHFIYKKLFYTAIGTIKYARITRGGADHFGPRSSIAVVNSADTL